MKCYPQTTFILWTEIQSISSSFVSSYYTAGNGPSIEPDVHPLDFLKVRYLTTPSLSSQSTCGKSIYSFFDWLGFLGIKKRLGKSVKLLFATVHRRCKPNYYLQAASTEVKAPIRSKGFNLFCLERFFGGFTRHFLTDPGLQQSFCFPVYKLHGLIGLGINLSQGISLPNKWDTNLWKVKGGNSLFRNSLWIDSAR